MSSISSINAYIDLNYKYTMIRESLNKIIQYVPNATVPDVLPDCVSKSLESDIENLHNALSKSDMNYDTDAILVSKFNNLLRSMAFEFEMKDIRKYVISIDFD